MAVSILAAAAWGAGEDFNFAILGDRTGGHVPGVYGEIIAEVNRLGPDVVVTVGDQIEGYTEDRERLSAEWDEYWEIAGAVEAPLYLCPGNHDIYNDVMLEEWEARVDRAPCYSFDYEGVHFVILDTGRWEASEDWLAESGYAEWLEQDLAAHKNDRLTIVIYHVPFWYETLAEGEPDPLHEIFVENGVDAVFNGHYHRYTSAEFDGISYTIIGTSGGGLGTEAPQEGLFFHYVWATVRGDEITWTPMRKDSSLPTDHVVAADVKLLERIEFEYVRFPALRYTEEAAAEGWAYYASLENGTEWEVSGKLEWETAGNWVVEPAAVDVALAPGETAELEFTATPAGDFYPLPTCSFEYPFRADRMHTCDRFLGAGRVQVVKRFEAPPVVDGDLGDACW
ncbi:MAG: metallophosphoesterase, partial [Candidatus Coatesbacteria bacterium]